MHQCVKNEIKPSILFRKSRQERQEEVCCSVCRVLFCCATDREKHEDAEHGREIATTARQQRQLLKINKPLVCSSCCQVFLSGLFVNEWCNNASSGISFKVKGTTHALIIIPEWAVEKYLVPHDKKRSWDKANEDGAEVGIVVHPADDKSTKDSIRAHENSFTQKTNIQSILTKQRKTDLAEKRGRRVTFSPVTAIAFTSRLSIVKMGSQKTGGESSPDSPPNSSNTALLSKSLEVERSEDSATATPKEGTTTSGFSPSLPSNEPDKNSPFEPSDTNNPDGVFSPPLPHEGTNGSPMMTPQMSSTPVTENSERITPMTPESLSKNEESQEGIFSSLANVICCAFQALPSVLTHFFSSINDRQTNDQTDRQESSSSGRHRRQRRRSATFTPYAPVTNKRRRFNQRNGQTLSPPSIVKFLRSQRRRPH